MGAVASGVAARTPALDQASTFRLVVEAPGHPSATRELTVGVRFRNRYAAAGTFVASQHTATLAGDGSVVLVGGSCGLTTLSESIDRFDPRTGTVGPIGALASGRGGHRATRLPSGSILVTGGLLSLGDSRLVELVDEASGRSSAVGTMSVPRVDHAAIALPGGAVLVTGGYASGERAAMGISDSVEIWEPAMQRFRRLAVRMRMARATHTMTLLPDGRVLVVGGYTAAATYQFAEIFDPQGESFTPVADSRPLRANHAAHAQADGRVLLLGGETVDGSGAIQPLASVLRFDAATGGFNELAPLTVPRTWAASVMLPSGRSCCSADSRKCRSTRPAPSRTTRPRAARRSPAWTAGARCTRPRAWPAAACWWPAARRGAGGGAYTGSLLVYE